MKNFIRKRLRKKDSKEEKKVERREVSLPSSHLGKQSFMVQRVLWHKYIRISTLLLRRSLSIIVSIEEGAIWKKTSSPFRNLLFFVDLSMYLDIWASQMSNWLTPLFINFLISLHRYTINIQFYTPLSPHLRYIFVSPYIHSRSQFHHTSSVLHTLQNNQLH